MKIKDGWRRIKGFEVYIEDGRVIRGIREDVNGGRYSAYPYKSVEDGWMIGKPAVSTFRKSNWELL